MWKSSPLYSLCIYKYSTVHVCVAHMPQSETCIIFRLFYLTSASSKNTLTLELSRSWRWCLAHPASQHTQNPQMKVFRIWKNVSHMWLPPGSGVDLGNPSLLIWSAESIILLHQIQGTHRCHTKVWVQRIVRSAEGLRAEIADSCNHKVIKSQLLTPMRIWLCLVQHVTSVWLIIIGWCMPVLSLCIRSTIVWCSKVCYRENCCN